MIDDLKWLSAGFCLHPEFTSIRGGSWKPCPFPAGFLFFHHRRLGPCLFDTGYSDHFHAATRHFPERLYAWATPPKLVSAERACDQLQAFGVAPSDVRHVIVSHFHADHIAGLRDFPRAKIVSARAGYHSIRGTTGFRGVLQGLLPALMPADSEARMMFIDDIRAVPLPDPLHLLGDGRDIFGDGAVMAVDLPGHAVHQIGLYLPETPKGPMLLAADAAWSVAAITSLRSPPRMVTSLLGNTAVYHDTLRKLHALAGAGPHLTICPSHERASVTS